MDTVRVALYARFSSDNQRDESIDAQIRAMLEYAKRNGYNVVEPYYIDRAKSATSDRRPEFQKMIKDAEKGLFNAILVHKLDRFSRDKYDSAIYKSKLKRLGIRLLSVTENLDGSPESLMMEAVLEGMAHYYSANLAREVMKGMTENALQAKHTGGTPPLGYDVDKDKKFIINEKEAEVVKFIFSQYLSGNGYNIILRELSKRGWKTKQGKDFSKTALYNILKNEKYKGVYIFNRYTGRGKFAKEISLYSQEDPVIRIEGGLPAIITEQDFEKVQGLLKHNKISGGANKAKEQYLLTGIAVCGMCGSPMQGNSRTGGKTDKMYKSYRCSCRMNKKQCTNKEIRKELIEDFVLDQLQAVICNEQLVPDIVRSINEKVQEQQGVSNQSISDMQKELEKINAQIDKVVTLIMDSVGIQSFTNKLKELENEKGELETKLQTLRILQTTCKVQTVTEEEIKESIKQVQRYIANNNASVCKKIIKDYVKQVIIYESHIEVIFNVAFSMSKYICMEQTRRISKIEFYEKYA